MSWAHGAPAGQDAARRSGGPGRPDMLAAEAYERGSLVEAAVQALSPIGDPHCRPVIEAALGRGSLRVRMAARQLLACLEECHERR